MLMECEDDIDEEGVDDVDDEMLKNANVFIPSSAHSTPLYDNNDNSNNHDDNDIDRISSSSHVDQLDALHHNHHHHLSSEHSNDHLAGSDSGRTSHSRGSGFSEMGSSTRTQPVGADAQNVSSESQAPKPSRIFKVVIIGDSSVGKSTFLHRFCHDEFKDSFSATIGVDFQIKSLNYDGSSVILQLWDTAGQERFRSMTKTYFRKADGVIVMYDVTSEKTFVGVRNWMTSVQEQVEDGTVLAVIGNKQDLSPDDGHRPVKMKDGQALAMEYQAIFNETSAKTGLNIEETMETMAKLLQEKEDKKLEEGLHLSEGKGEGKKKCCG